MSNTAVQLLVFVSDKLACIKIKGRANFTSSLDFKTVIEELIGKGFSCIVLDLTDCLLMDSTFLGVLAGLGLKMNSDKKADGHAIELMNPNPRIAELLENLGVLHLFHVMAGPAPEMAAGGVEQAAVPEVKASREEVISNCLEAHKLLMAIDPANIPKFKEVTQFLAEDLKKIQAAGNQGTPVG